MLAGDSEAVEMRGEAFIEALQIVQVRVRRGRQRAPHDEQACRFVGVLMHHRGNDDARSPLLVR